MFKAMEKFPPKIRSSKKKRFLRSLLIISPIIGIAGCYFLAVEMQLRKYRHFLLKDVNHKAVAEGCMKLVQLPYATSIDDTAFLSNDDTNVSPAIRAIKPMHVVIRSNEVMIAKTGGHYYMGYIFKPSVSDSNEFVLSFREEKSSQDIPLFSLRRPTN